METETTINCGEMNDILVRKYQQALGNEQERKKIAEQFITLNENELWYIIRKYWKPNPVIDKDDLYQQAVITTLDCLDKYRTDRTDVKFSTYLWVSLNHTLMDSMNIHAKSVKLSTNSIRDYTKILKAANESVHAGDFHYADLSDEKVLMKLCKRTGLNQNETKNMTKAVRLQAAGAIISYESMSVETASDGMFEEQVINKQFIEHLLSRISTDEQEVVCMRFGLNGSDKIPTLREIAEQKGMTIPQIYQLQKNGIKKMRQVAIMQ